MIRTFRALVQVSPGFADPASLQSFRIYIPETQIPGHAGRARSAHGAGDSRQAGRHSRRAVRSAIATQRSHGRDTVTSIPCPPRIAPTRKASCRRCAASRFVGPGFFSTMGSPLICRPRSHLGRRLRKRPVAIISRELRARVLGQRRQRPRQARARRRPRRTGARSSAWSETIYDDGVDKPPQHRLLAAVPGSLRMATRRLIRRGVEFIIRSPRAGSAAFMNEMQQAVWSVDPDLPLAET